MKNTVIAYLKSGKVLEYRGDKHTAEFEYSAHLSKFIIWFNGKLWSYKTYYGANNKLNYFINKYNLEQVF